MPEAAEMSSGAAACIVFMSRSICTACLAMSPRPTAKQQPNNSQTAAKQQPEGLQQPNDHPTNLVKARDHGGGVEVSAEARVQAQGGRAGCEGDEVVRARGDATRDGTEAAGADREASAEVCTVSLLEAGDVGREEQGRGLEIGRAHV